MAAALSEGYETLNREKRFLFAFLDSLPLAACQLSPFTVFVSACATSLRTRFQSQEMTCSFIRTKNSMEPFKGREKSKHEEVQKGHRTNTRSIS